MGRGGVHFGRKLCLVRDARPGKACSYQRPRRGSVLVDRRFCRHGYRHLVHALRRHAGVLVTHRAGVHQVPDVPLMDRRGCGVGDRAGRGQPRLAIRPAPGRGVTGNGGRHLLHALHWYGGAGHGARDCVEQDSGRSLGRDRRYSLGSSAIDLLLVAQGQQPARPDLPSRCRCGDGLGHQRHALHRYGCGEFPGRHGVPEC